MGTDKRARQKAGRAQRLEQLEQAKRKDQSRRRLTTFLAIGGVFAILVGLYLFLGRDSDDTDVAADDSTTTTVGDDASGVVPPPGPGASIDGETPCPPEDGSAERTTSFEDAPPLCIDPDASYTAVFDTNQGEIRVALDTERMPNTVNNFVVLSRYGYYDGTSIFRTDTSIEIIQGGSPTTNSPSDPGPGYTIEDEGGEFDFSGSGTGPFTYVPGQLVMARSQGPNSSGAQFFFTAGPAAANLDSQGTYLVFGEVVEGLDVVEAILALHEDDPASMLGGGPSEPVVINSVTIEQD